MEVEKVTSYRLLFLPLDRLTISSQKRSRKKESSFTKVFQPEVKQQPRTVRLALNKTKTLMSLVSKLYSIIRNVWYLQRQINL
jgi:hypothetical protein